MGKGLHKQKKVVAAVIDGIQNGIGMHLRVKRVQQQALYAGIYGNGEAGENACLEQALFYPLFIGIPIFLYFFRRIELLKNKSLIQTDADHDLILQLQRQLQHFNLLFYI